MTIENKLIGIGKEAGDSKLTVTLFFGMRAIKLNFWAKARRSPRYYYYSPVSMKFVYSRCQLSFNWFVGLII